MLEFVSCNPEVISCNLGARGQKKEISSKKSTNGNGGKKCNTLKIASWNLGARNWTRKTEDIDHLISDLDPDIIVLSEANLQSSSEPHEVNIRGYKLFTTLDYDTIGISRLVVLVKLELNCNLMQDKMETNIASIWISFPRRGRRAFILGAVYREHKLANQQQPNISGDPATQKERWCRIIEQWETIQDGHDALVVGDLNVDHQKWGDPEEQHKEMTELVKDKIEVKGFVQLVKGPTRFWHNTVPSLLDQSWTNNPESIISCKNLNRPVADHNLILTSVRLKGKINKKNEILKRNWKKFDQDKFKKDIEDIDWKEIYKLEDPNLAYSFLEEKLQTTLDLAAPIMKLQPTGRQKNWLSNETRDMIKDRDFLKEIAVETNDDEDWRIFRKH